jgi:hypothetical protein
MLNSMISPTRVKHSTAYGVTAGLMTTAKAASGPPWPTWRATGTGCPIAAACTPWLACREGPSRAGATWGVPGGPCRYPANSLWTVPATPTISMAVEA